MTGRRRKARVRPHLSTPEQSSHQKLLRALAYVVAFIDSGNGISYLLGKPPSTASYMALSRVVPLEMWGAVLLAGGALIIAAQSFVLMRSYMAGFLLGFGPWAMLSAATWTIFVQEGFAGAGAPWTATGLAAVHFLAVAGTNEALRVRRSE